MQAVDIGSQFTPIVPLQSGNIVAAAAPESVCRVSVSPAVTVYCSSGEVAIPVIVPALAVIVSATVARSMFKVFILVF